MSHPYFADGPSTTKTKTTYTLTDPRRGDYTETHAGLGLTRRAAARACGVAVDEMVEVELNGVTYCYPDQHSADHDDTGAYAVQYE